MNQCLPKNDVSPVSSSKAKPMDLYGAALSITHALVQKCQRPVPPPIIVNHMAVESNIFIDFFIMILLF